MILLVVDTQKLITNQKLYAFDKFERTVKTLISAARDNGVEVIYVRHDDGAGAELTKGTTSFEIYKGFSPRACLKIAFCKMCFTLCGRFAPNLGGVAGYID